MVIAVAVVAIPFATDAGNEAYFARMHTISKQVQTRFPVEAVAVGDSTGPVGRFTRANTVRVQWREGTHTRTGVIASPAIVKAGAPLIIWLDTTGKVTAAPDTATAAKSDAVGRALVVWLGAVALGVLFARAVRRWLDRCRAAAWDRDVRLLAHNDDGWANRHI